MEKIYSVYSHLPRFVPIARSYSTIEGMEEKKGYVSFTFAPGENFVPGKTFELIKDVPMFKELCSLGLKGFEAPDDLGEAMAVGEPESKGFQVEALLSLPSKKLISKIKGELGKEGLLDVELLYLLQQKENRNTVLKAIDEQFKKLNVKRD